MIFITARNSIFQAPPDPLLRTMEGAADGAFVYAPFPGDLWDGLLLEIVGDDHLLLAVGELLADHPFYPLELYLPGQPGPQIAVKEYISHCANTPGHNSGR